MKFAIAGSGLAGLSCADALVDAGHSVVLFDKGRGPGGRMSTRRLETPLGQVAIDHGAQYFTVRDPGFGAVVDDWEKRGLAQPWSLAGGDAWVGTPAMNSVIKDMCARHDVTFGLRVTGLVRDGRQWHMMAEDGQSLGPFDGIVLALPSEQSAPILALHDFAMAHHALQARSQPCWTAMYVFAERLPIVSDVIRDMGDIAWAARNSAKPGRTGPEAWVVQATPSWSNAHLEENTDAVAARLFAALENAVSHSLPLFTIGVGHRWRFALSAGTQAGALWNADLGLGVCGDWLLGPRVESAWQSGRMLADNILVSDQVLMSSDAF